MKKHYTVLMLVTLLITLSACGRPDVDKNDVVPEQPVETETTEEQVYIEDSIEDSIEDFIEDPQEDSIQDVESSSEAEEEIKEETEWLETDEQWRGRRTRSNSELEVTIERTDRSLVNEDGVTIAIIYYDRPVVSGDTAVAEKITEFFEEEEQNWFTGKKGRLLNYSGDCDSALEFFLELVGNMREMFGDEHIVEYECPCLYNIESRIMYMDDDILSILQIKEFRTQRGSTNYYGCTFDLHTGELLKLKDLDISAEDIKNIFSQDEYLDHFSEMSEDYILVAHEKEYDMSGQFYVDEKYLYLLDNTEKKYNDGIIYRIDEAGELVTLRYVVEREGNKNRILTWITKDGALW
mgnify:FL=1